MSSEAGAVRSVPSFQNFSRTAPTSSASSEARSTRMCRAPSSAAATSATWSLRKPAASLQTGLAGDLRLGAALGLVRQVDVLDAGLGLRGQQRVAQFVGELALLLDGGQHGLASLVEFPQVAQSLLQRAQLSVVEAAGDLLAVPRDEGDRGPLVEQPDRRRDLGLRDSQFLGQTGVHRLQHSARIHGARPYRTPPTPPVWDTGGLAHTWLTRGRRGYPGTWAFPINTRTFPESSRR
jgi:hypothetical protein